MLASVVVLLAVACTSKSRPLAVGAAVEPAQRSSSRRRSSPSPHRHGDSGHLRAGGFSLAATRSHSRRSSPCGTHSAAAFGSSMVCFSSRRTTRCASTIPHSVSHRGIARPSPSATKRGRYGRRASRAIASRVPTCAAARSAAAIGRSTLIPSHHLGRRIPRQRARAARRVRPRRARARAVEPRLGRAHRHARALARRCAGARLRAGRRVGGLERARVGGGARSASWQRSTDPLVGVARSPRITARARVPGRG